KLWRWTWGLVRFSGLCDHSVRQLFLFWLRQKKTQDQPDYEDGGADDGRSHSNLFEGGAGQARREQVRGDERSRGADHASSHIGREAASSGAQVQRENLG